MSPPTHDVNTEDRTSTELSQLQNEITRCLQQIKNIRLQSLKRGSYQRHLVKKTPFPFFI